MILQGYLEEEVRLRIGLQTEGPGLTESYGALQAVITYTRCLQDISAGYVPEWMSAEGATVYPMPGEIFTG